MSKWDSLKGKVPQKPIEDPKFLEKVDLARQRYASMTVKEIYDRFNKLDERKDALNQSIKALNVELKALDQLIMANLESQGVRSVHTDFGKTIFVRIEPSVTVENRDQLFSHIDSDNGLDYLWSVNPQTLKTLVKTMLEEGLSDEEISKKVPGVKIYLDSSIQIRKS